MHPPSKLNWQGPNPGGSSGKEIRQKRTVPRRLRPRFSLAGSQPPCLWFTFFYRLVGKKASCKIMTILVLQDKKHRFGRFNSDRSRFQVLEMGQNCFVSRGLFPFSDFIGLWRNSHRLKVLSLRSQMAQISSKPDIISLVKWKDTAGPPDSILNFWNCIYEFTITQNRVFYTYKKTIAKHMCLSF